MDDVKILDDLEKYLALFQDIKRRTDDERIAEIVLVEIAKDARVRAMRRGQEEKEEEPATEKQLSFLRRLAVEIEAESGSRRLSKKRASPLIDQATKKEKEEKVYPEVVRIP